MSTPDPARIGEDASIAPRRAVSLPRWLRPRVPGAKLRRRLLLAGLCAVLLLAALLGAGAVYVLTLPGVGDAGARVERILAAHHGKEGSLPPLAKLRQRHVLERLVANHVLTEAQANAAFREPLGLR